MNLQGEWIIVTFSLTNQLGLRANIVSYPLDSQLNKYG